MSTAFIGPLDGRPAIFFDPALVGSVDTVDFPAYNGVMPSRKTDLIDTEYVFRQLGGPSGVLALLGRNSYARSAATKWQHRGLSSDAALSLVAKVVHGATDKIDLKLMLPKDGEHGENGIDA